MEKNGTDSIVYALRTVEDFCFQDTLKSLAINECSIDEK